MNGFQIGNKRLKVQHKRVHSSTVHQQQNAALDAPFPSVPQHDGELAPQHTDHPQAGNAPMPLPVNP